MSFFFSTFDVASFFLIILKGCNHLSICRASIKALIKGSMEAFNEATIKAFIYVFYDVSINVSNYINIAVFINVSIDYSCI